MKKIIHLNESVAVRPLDTEEKIQVAKIRVTIPTMRLEAVLGEFRAADKFVCACAACAIDYFEYDFEVTFLDGFIILGRYESRKKKRGSPSLSGFIRSRLKAYVSETNAPPNQTVLLRGEGHGVTNQMVVQNLLEVYDIEVS